MIDLLDILLIIGMWCWLPALILFLMPKKYTPKNRVVTVTGVFFVSAVLINATMNQSLNLESLLIQWFMAMLTIPFTWVQLWSSARFSQVQFLGYEPVTVFVSGLIAGIIADQTDYIQKIQTKIKPWIKSTDQGSSST